VEQAGDQTIAGRKQPPDTPCILRFPWHGSEHVSGARVLAGREEFIAAGDTVRIFVNPDDPDDWTARVRPGSMAPRLLGAGIALLAGLIGLLVSWFCHRRVLWVWREGEAVESLVIESRHTALAPLAQAVRCTPQAEKDTRIFTVYSRARGDRLERGEAIWVLARPKRAAGAEAASWLAP
jgi:hypothetical protein